MHRLLNNGLVKQNPSTPVTVGTPPEHTMCNFVIGIIIIVLVSIVVMGGVGGFFALIVIAFGALVDSNTDEVMLACGKTLWVIVLLELVVPWVVGALGSMCFYCGKELRSFLFTVWFGVWYGVFSFVMCLGYIQEETTRIHKNEMCMDALRAHSLGMNRALLLDLMSFFYILNMIVLSVIVICLFFLSVSRCESDSK